MGFEVAGAGGAFDEAEGDGAVEECADDVVGVAADEGEVDAGMEACEVAEETGENILGDGGAGAEGEMAGVGAGEGGDFLLGAGEEGVGLLGIAEKEFAGGGEEDAGAGAVE